MALFFTTFFIIALVVLLMAVGVMFGRKAIKGTRYLLLRGKENLSPERLPDLEAALKLNEPLSIAYYLKEELRTLWSYRKIEEMAVFLDDWIKRAMGSGIALLATFAKTLLAFRSAILNSAKTLSPTANLKASTTKSVPCNESIMVSGTFIFYPSASSPFTVLNTLFADEPFFLIFLVWQRKRFLPSHIPS
jgi:hypothetical protein